MFKFWEWTKDTWTLVVAVIALVQPWVVGAYKRLFKAGAVDINETALIEVGYSPFGATIGLQGTLRSRDRDLFIKFINLTLVKQRDNSKYQFDWVVFRTAKTIIGQSGEVALDVPSSFMIATAQPHRYNIVFSDTKLFQEIRPTLEGIRQSWLTYLQGIGQSDELEEYLTSANPALKRKLLKSLKRSYDKFSILPEQVNSLTILEKAFYWEPGIYRLSIHVGTTRPDRHYSKSWSFTLLEADVNNLRNNVITIMEETCGIQQVGQYMFIYTAYA
ncbi:MAG TPA: hypothetical protein VGC66_00105 [Pyrinomonadaceae bacterium]|jgi:hypothetical protein